MILLPDPRLCKCGMRTDLGIGEKGAVTMAGPSDTIKADVAGRWEKCSKVELLKQLVYEKSISGCARSLLCSRQAEDALSGALDDLVHVNPDYQGFIAKSSDDGSEGCRFHVVATTQGGDRAESRKSIALCFEDSERLLEKMVSGEVFSGLLKDPDCLGQGELKGISGASVLCAPIRALDTWWGVLGLVSRSSDPQWEQEDYRMLLAAAEFFSVHLERQEALTEHEEKNRLAGALEMAGVVCHKLNQPTQVILGYSSMITSGDIKERDQIIDVVKMIEDETRKMGIITKNLMGITRMREAISAGDDSSDVNLSESTARIESPD